VVSAVQRAWDLLEQIPDPEIPVVSIRELGILREVNAHDGGVEIVITPTYSGCPAMGQIEDDVRSVLAAAGLRAQVVTRLAPAWTTDWMTDAAKLKLREYGIAPPHTTQPAESVLRFQKARPAAAIACPRCGSANTTETSHFGSTACKSLHKCLDCLEPFDYFKPY
jgi:ring-1,2-phenylacetyl-CoA epoxidase subunit PaaD